MKLWDKRDSEWDKEQEDEQEKEDEAEEEGEEDLGILVVLAFQNEIRCFYSLFFFVFW